MNARNITAAVAVLMLLLGLAGLFYPEAVKGMLGLEAATTSRKAFVLGEMRATYGGLFVAAGAYLLFAAMDTAANRTLILFVALLWIGAAAGRLFGVVVDGNPGLFGWLSVVFELAGGGALLYAWAGSDTVGV